MDSTIEPSTSHLCLQQSWHRKKNPQTTALYGILFLSNLHIVLPEDGMWVLKHLEETNPLYVLIKNCTFGWYN
jgi:hypothetical protein